MIGATQYLIEAAVKAERERICDLFLTEPISFPVGINTDADEIDASIKSDRFKLMTAVREGKPFKAVMAKVFSGDAPTTGDAHLLAKARALVIEHQKASISQVQRTLNIGYNQANRLLESLEISGVVGPMDANGRRVVMVKGGAQ